MRISAADYHAVVAVSPEVGVKLGEMARDRIGGLQGITADQPPPRAIIVGPRWDPACSQLRRFLDRNQVTFRWITSDTPDAEELWGGPLPPDDDCPVIRVVNGKTVVKPRMSRVAELLGLSTEPALAEYDAVIVGAGPPAWRPRCTARRRGCAPSSSSARRPAARRAPRPASRTTWGSRPASRATSWRCARCSRLAGWAPRSW